MRSSASLALLLAGAVSASPAIDLKTLFCKINNGIIKVLDKEASATPYCSNFLSIPTSTFSTTVYETPSSAYFTQPVTITGEATTTTETDTVTSTAYETSTTTIIQTDYATTTQTNSITTLGCLSSAYTYVPPIGTIPPAEPSNDAVADKRGLKLGHSIKKPACIPSDWPKAHISNACKCLQIPTPSTTLTFTETLATGTITVDSTVIVTPTSTAIETTTEVPTSTLIETATSTTTITRTAFATETAIAQGPLAFHRYSHNFDAQLENPGFTASHFKGQAPIISGITTNTFFASTRLLQFSGYPAFEAYHSAVLFQGFFVAQDSGTYTFESPASQVDNWAYLWLGDAALNWNDGNTSFKSSRTGAGPYTNSGTFQMRLGKGDAVPMTYLWANGGGDGKSYLVIRRPNGQLVTISPMFLAAACPGTFR